MLTQQTTLVYRDNPAMRIFLSVLTSPVLCSHKLQWQIPPHLGMVLCPFKAKGKTSDFSGVLILPRLFFNKCMALLTFTYLPQLHSEFTFILLILQ